MSLALCLCMVTGLLPVTALAADVPAITTETLEAAMVGEEYTAVLEAEASDPSGTLTWEAEGLPAWLELWDNADGHRLAYRQARRCGGVYLHRHGDRDHPGGIGGARRGTGRRGGRDPADAPQHTVLTDTKTYTLTVAEAVRAEPEPEPGITNGITPLAVTKKVPLDFNLYLQPESGGMVEQEDTITQFSIANELFLKVDNYPGTNPTKIALISSTLDVANLNETTSTTTPWFCR